MLDRIDRASSLEGVAGPVATGPAHSVRDADVALVATLFAGFVAIVWLATRKRDR